MLGDTTAEGDRKSPADPLQTSPAEPPNPGSTPPVAEPSVPGSHMSEELEQMRGRLENELKTKLEQELKEKMTAHAQALEKHLVDDILDRKRKAEEELDNEMETRRQKRLRDLEEELAEEKLMKETELASLECQLQERMQLVANEQSHLDDLKDKAIDMQRKLEMESEQLTARALVNPPNTPVPPGPTADDKSTMKEKLREKIEKQLKNQQVSDQRTPVQTVPCPSPVTAAPSTSPSEHGGNAIVPMTDMRFTSSTHPAAWQFLYRLTRKEDQCDKTIYETWHAGASISESMSPVNQPHIRLQKIDHSLIQFLEQIPLEQVDPKETTCSETLYADATTLVMTLGRTRPCKSMQSSCVSGLDSPFLKLYIDETNQTSLLQPACSRPSCMHW